MLSLRQLPRYGEGLVEYALITTAPTLWGGVGRVCSHRDMAPTLWVGGGIIILRYCGKEVIDSQTLWKEGRLL